MASRLCELEWLRFMFEPEHCEPQQWRVLFTTPTLIPRRKHLRAFRNKQRYTVGYCEWATRTIYIDAGLDDNQIGETLQHELWHVPREGADIDRDHELIYASSPFVWKAWAQFCCMNLPPYPDGFERLRRSSRRYRTRREWE